MNSSRRRGKFSFELEKKYCKGNPFWSAPGPDTRHKFQLRSHPSMEIVPYSETARCIFLQSLFNVETCVQLEQYSGNKFSSFSLQFCLNAALYICAGGRCSAVMPRLHSRVHNSGFLISI